MQSSGLPVKNQLRLGKTGPIKNVFSLMLRGLFVANGTGHEIRFSPIRDILSSAYCSNTTPTVERDHDAERVSKD